MTALPQSLMYGVTGDHDCVTNAVLSELVAAMIVPVPAVRMMLMISIRKNGARTSTGASPIAAAATTRVPCAAVVAPICKVPVKPSVTNELPTPNTSRSSHASLRFSRTSRMRPLNVLRDSARCSSISRAITVSSTFRSRSTLRMSSIGARLCVPVSMLRCTRAANPAPSATSVSLPYFLIRWFAT